MRRSFWLKSISDQLKPQAPLSRNAQTDIAIIGGGYVGLWTALQLRKKAPEAKIILLEQDICGGGASGRNGGFVMSWWPKINSLRTLCGSAQAIQLANASVNAISEIDDFCQQHNIDAHFKQNGWIWTATSQAQMYAWQSTVRLCNELGEQVFVSLSKEELLARSGSPVHLSGIFDRTVATVQPAKLVRGLYRVALLNNIEIYENTQVFDFTREKKIKINTRNGIVTTDQLILATNAWASSVPELRKIIIPVTSTVLITEPIPERLKQIGWTGGEAITDSQLMVDYYRTTRDGRIAFGKGTGSISFAGRINQKFEYNHTDAILTEQDFRRIFPMLNDVKIEQTWSGPIDRSYNSLPILGTLPDTDNIHYGIGWSGNGVGPSLIGGKILSSLALGIDDEWRQCGLVNRPVKEFPAEPVRYLGGSLVRKAVIRKEAAEANGSSPGFLDVELASLAPSGMEDK